MPDFSRYMMVSYQINDTQRAVDAWNRIQGDPTTITLKGTVSGQVVRVEFNGAPIAVASNAGDSAMLRCTVFGVQGHPDVSVVDTVIDADDQFALEIASKKVIFVVQRVITPPGEVQAFCESR